MKVRVFQPPGQQVQILILNEKLRLEGESDDDFLNRIAPGEVEKCNLVGLPFADIDKAEVYALDRSKRYAWRLDGKKVKIDNAVPEPRHPKQDSVDKINAATTLDELKAALSMHIKGK